MAAPGPTIIGHSSPTMQSGTFIPGARGLVGPPVGMPGGATSYVNFMPQSLQRDAIPPMERPVMVKIRNEVSAWFSRFLEATRGTPLQPNEPLPMLLLTMWALYHVDRVSTYDALSAMKSMTVPLTASKPVRVVWEHQPYDIVPYEVRHFPLHVATKALDLVKSSVFDDVNPLWYEKRERYALRLLDQSERVQLGFLPFRAPTAEEKAASSNDYGGAPTGPLQMGQTGGGAGILVQLHPQMNAEPVTVGAPAAPPIGTFHTADRAGSLDPTKTPGGPPMFHQPAAQPGVAAAVIPGGVPPAAPSFGTA